MIQAERSSCSRTLEPSASRSSKKAYTQAQQPRSQSKIFLGQILPRKPCLWSGHIENLLSERRAVHWSKELTPSPTGTSCNLRGGKYCWKFALLAAPPASFSAVCKHSSMAFATSFLSVMVTRSPSLQVEQHLTSTRYPGQDLDSSVAACGATPDYNAHFPFCSIRRPKRLETIPLLWDVIRNVATQANVDNMAYVFEFLEPSCSR